MKLKAVIVDDELNAREEIEYLLCDIDDIDIIAKCSNAIEAIKTINTKHPDVLFLDIQLPKIDGFEMLSMLEKSIMPYVVFITAYDEYAIKAFEEDAVDYLLKPVEKTRLIKTVEKLCKVIKSKDIQNIEIPILKRIPSKVARRIELIDIDEIEYVNSDITGVIFYSGNKRYFTDLTLKVLEERTQLFRCHKQYLVNLDKVDKIILEENSTAKIRTVNNQVIPVSRSYLKDFKEKWKI